VAFVSALPPIADIGTAPGRYAWQVAPAAWRCSPRSAARRLYAVFLRQILLNLVIGWGLVMGTTPAHQERPDRISRIEHLLHIRCLFCGAPPGELCRTKAGREILSISLMHDARIAPTRVHKRYRRFS
jgi:hypothetical protein